MESKRFPLPEQKKYESAYELAYKLACQELARVQDIEEQCRKSGAQYKVIDTKKTILIQYLNHSYSIVLPDVEVSVVGSPERVPLREKILILHYFNSAKGTPLANTLVTFRDLPEGSAYFPTFSKRTIKPLLDHFAEEPRRLFAASEKLGGRKTDYGDAAVTINAFHRVPITIVLWRGDDEFAPEGSILFDAAICDCLPTEDIIVLCEIITWKIIRSLKEA